LLGLRGEWTKVRFVSETGVALACAAPESLVMAAFSLTPTRKARPISAATPTFRASPETRKSLLHSTAEDGSRPSNVMMIISIKCPLKL
jgi:hypothetical protein